MNDMKKEEIFEDLSIPYLVDKRTGKAFPLPAVIPARGEITLLAPNTWPPTLEDLQSAVGGYIEYVPVPALPGLVMVVDEEGTLKHKPLNAYASEIAGRVIVGDVVLMEREEEE